MKFKYLVNLANETQQIKTMFYMFLRKRQNLGMTILHQILAARNMPKKIEKEKEVKDTNQLKTQFRILTKLYNVVSESGVKHLDINKLMEFTEIKDEKELMRALFILEGHKLVGPSPAGDFTSRYWGITNEGVKLIKNSSGTRMAA